MLLFTGILLASVMGVPPVDNLSSVERISFAVEERGAGGEEEGPGELCGDDGAVEGSEDGGGGKVLL